MVLTPLLGTIRLRVRLAPRLSFSTQQGSAFSRYRVRQPECDEADPSRLIPVWQMAAIDLLPCPWIVESYLLVCHAQYCGSQPPTMQEKTLRRASVSARQEMSCGDARPTKRRLFLVGRASSLAYKTSGEDAQPTKRRLFLVGRAPPLAYKTSGENAQPTKRRLLLVGRASSLAYKTSCGDARPTKRHHAVPGHSGRGLA